MLLVKEVSRPNASPPNIRTPLRALKFLFKYKTGEDFIFEGLTSLGVSGNTLSKHHLKEKRRGLRHGAAGSEGRPVAKSCYDGGMRGEGWRNVMTATASG